MSAIVISKVAKELVNFVRSLPDIYRSISFSDPLVIFVLILLASLVIGLAMSVRSPVVTLLIVFTMLILSFLSGTLHKWLASHTTVLLGKKLISQRYFDDNGKFVMAIWTFPMFCVATFFSLIMIVTLLVEISNQIRNVSKEAKGAKQLSKKRDGEQSEPQSEVQPGVEAEGEGGKPAEAAAEPAGEDTQK